MVLLGTLRYLLIAVCSLLDNVFATCGIYVDSPRADSPVLSPCLVPRSCVVFVAYPPKIPVAFLCFCPFARLFSGSGGLSLPFMRSSNGRFARYFTGFRFCAEQVRKHTESGAGKAFKSENERGRGEMNGKNPAKDPMNRINAMVPEEPVNPADPVNPSNSQTA